MSDEIALNELLPNKFYINKDGNMVAEISLEQINQIGDILTNYYKENKRLIGENLILRASEEMRKLQEDKVDKKDTSISLEELESYEPQNKQEEMEQDYFWDKE